MFSYLFSLVSGPMFDDPIPYGNIVRPYGNIVRPYGNIVRPYGNIVRPLQTYTATRNNSQTPVERTIPKLNNLVLRETPG